MIGVQSYKEVMEETSRAFVSIDSIDERSKFVPPELLSCELSKDLGLAWAKQG